MCKWSCSWNFIVHHIRLYKLVSSEIAGSLPWSAQSIPRDKLRIKDRIEI